MTDDQALMSDAAIYIAAVLDRDELLVDDARDGYILAIGLALASSPSTVYAVHAMLALHVETSRRHGQAEPRGWAQLVEMATAGGSGA